MSQEELPGPVTRSMREEHEVRDPARVQALVDAIAEDPAQMQRLRNRHVLSMAHFDAPLLLQILRLAGVIEKCKARDEHPLEGKILSNLFWDNSRSHTRLSFNSAWLRMGGSLLNFEKAVDQITLHRHAPDELVQLCNAYGDAAVLRTIEGQELTEMVGMFEIPVINAGNGEDEHPTNAMADLYTLFKWRPDLLDPKTAGNPLQIGIFGHHARTRTIRSFLLALARFPHAVERVVFFERRDNMFVCQEREQLEEAGLTIQLVEELHPMDSKMKAYQSIVPELDVVYIHSATPHQYTRMELIEGMSYLRKDAMVLNPRIQTQVFSDLLNDSTHNAYFTQIRGAVPLRMALFCGILGCRVGTC